MIRYLAIRNLAVIESVAVEFDHSFNILTGETGAGKSILVEAVGLLLGGRASQDLVRTGEETATVEAIFEVPANGAVDAGERGAERSDTKEIVVRREITAQGRSRAFISGALATAAALRDLSNRLVELHGQHEHQQLLDPEQHLSILDAWAGLQDGRQEVATAYARVRELREALDRLRMDSGEREARLELVEFQLNELIAVAPKPGEEKELSSLRQVLRHADTIDRLCKEGYGKLYESDDSLLAGLGRLWRRVGELAAIDSRFLSYLDQRDSIKAELEDLAFALRDFRESLDTAPGRLQQVEDRLARLERLKRKYGATLEEVIARREALEAERRALTGDSRNAEVVEAELARASQAFLQQARLLSSRRSEGALRFAGALEQELADLAMERTRFEVRLSTDDEDSRWSEQGIDRGEFYLSPNPGEDLRPLARIVSGGELSRLMLALKTLAVADQPGKTLIFDEVDAGIGGRVASVVGQKLRALGERFQVLCISHLPQIAAAGTTHFHIEKHVRGDRTVTSVSRLDETARVAELARMIGGTHAGERAKASALELLEAAQAKGGWQAKAKGEAAAGRKRK